MKFEEAIVKVEGLQSEQEVKEAALCLFNLIPTIWHDEDFRKDVKNAKTTIKVDVRKEWCGKKVGEPKFEDEEKIEPYLLVNACVNLLERRELLGKKKATEKVEGVYFEPNGEESESEI